MAVAVLAAIAGDSAGYQLGRVTGPRLLGLRPLRRRQAVLNRWGARAVILGRFTAFLRAAVPGLAGISQMPYRRFLAANAAGGLAWAAGFTLLGYALGSAYHTAERYSAIASTVLLARGRRQLPRLLPGGQAPRCLPPGAEFLAGAPGSPPCPIRQRPQQRPPVTRSRRQRR